MDDFNVRIRDLTGRHVDWDDIDRAPGGRDYQPRQLPVVVTVVPEPVSTATSEPSAAPRAAVAPRGAVIDRRAEIAAARPPVSQKRGLLLWAKQALAAGDHGLAEAKAVRAEIEAAIEKGKEE